MATKSNPQSKQTKEVAETETATIVAAPEPGPITDAINEYNGIIGDLSGPEPVWCYGEFCKKVVIQ